MSFVKFQYLNCKSAIVSEVNEIKKKVLILLKVIFFLLGHADATAAASVQNCLLFATTLTFLQRLKKELKWLV